MKYVVITLLAGSLALQANGLETLNGHLKTLQEKFKSLARTLEQPKGETPKQTLNEYLTKLEAIVEGQKLAGYLKEASEKLGELKIFGMPDITEEQGLPKGAIDLANQFNKKLEEIDELKYFDLLADIGMIFSKYEISKQEKEKFEKILQAFGSKIESLQENIKYFQKNKDEIYNRIYSLDVAYIENFEKIKTALRLSVNKDTEKLTRNFTTITENLTKLTTKMDTHLDVQNMLPILKLIVFYVSDTKVLNEWKQLLTQINEKFKIELKEPIEPEKKEAYDTIQDFIKNARHVIDNINEQLINLEGK